MLALTSGFAPNARAQSLSHMPVAGKAMGRSAVDRSSTSIGTELARPSGYEGNTGENDEALLNPSPYLSLVVPVPIIQDKQPDLTANPGRPAMATSALLTPLGYAQFESGLLYAAGSAEFSNRSGDEETMRLTVAPRLQFIVATEPIAYSNTGSETLTQRGDATGGVQVVMMPGHGVRPTISMSYLHLLKGGTATSLDIGGYANSALWMASSDLGRFHVDANAFLNETEGPVRRGQWGQAVAVSHPLTAKLGATAELRYFTQPLTGGDGFSALWAASYSVRPNLVFDTGLVRGFNGTSTQWQVASGFTYVLPHRIWSFSHVPMVQ